MNVTMYTRENGRPRRRANRIGHCGIVKEHAVFCNPIDVWRFDQGCIIRTDGSISVVIRHHEDNVGPL